MSDAVRQLAWPAARLGEALREAALRSGLIPPGEASPDLAQFSPAAGDALNVWLDAAAAAVGIEVEPFANERSHLERELGRSVPAILRLPNGMRSGFLIALRSGGRWLWVLTPALEEVRVETADIGAELRRDAEQKLIPAVEPVIDSLRLSGKRRERAQSALLREMLGGTRIETGWLIRSSPTAPLSIQFRDYRLWGDLARFLVCHAAYFGLWIASWWVLGAAVLEGRIDSGWMLAWGLTLLTLLPFRLLSIDAGGRLAVRAGLVVRRRLLHGALQLDPDQVRTMGSGQLLGRVLESETFDTLALSGGMLTATALIELACAGLVLSTGAGGFAHAAVLAGWVLVTGLLTRRYVHRRRRWTDERFEMTDDLVEKMVGHRTRMAQERPQNWHVGEDERLARYHDSSRALDESEATLCAVIPRGWLLVGTLVLASRFMFAPPSTATFALALGGILAAYQAFRTLVEGIDRTVAAAIAWDRIRLFWEAAARRERPPTALLPAGRESIAGEPILEARELAYRYPQRIATVLNSVDVRVCNGDRILLEGPSGGGKSTLAALLAGLREPESGLLLLSGFDRQTLGTRSWRRHVVLAPQFSQNHVLLGSLAFNLLLGRNWPPSPADIVDAEGVCRSLGLGPLVARMPGGLHQLVGETGWQLSQGEKSRLFIARALLQGADLLILDESCDALDPETHRITVDTVLDRAQAVVLIAHP